jgi:hypothetical protein
MRKGNKVAQLSQGTLDRQNHRKIAEPQVEPVVETTKKKAKKKAKRKK